MQVSIGIDLLGSIATLLSAMLPAAGERLVHVPGLAVNRARQGSVGGQAKSDPKDARAVAPRGSPDIADQLGLRPADFRPITVQDETVAELRLLVSPRADLVTGQTRHVTASLVREMAEEAVACRARVVALACRRIDVPWAMLASCKPLNAEHRKAA